MNIQKWGGLVTAASPYALPAGAATEQNNLQIRKPGQLVTRPGMTFIRQANTSAVVGLHRQSPGGLQPDRLLSFCIVDEPTSGTYDYSLQSLTLVNNALSAETVFTVTSNSNLRPSFALDRHGSVYVFFGNGIRPRTYRYSVSATTTEAFGLDAPTVAPVVSPSGTGWFIERVDVLSSGTSYYAAPNITVTPATGDSPTRHAKLRAVVQAGQIVAVDVVDGGNNYKKFPVIEINSEGYVGKGFVGRGIRSVASAVYGFLDTTALVSSPTQYPTGSLDANKTHSYFDPTSTDYKIAYKSGATTAFATATFDPVAVQYTAFIPLTPVSTSVGKDAYAEVKFNPLSAAFKLGSTAPDYQTGATSYSTTGNVIAFRAVQSSGATGWTTADNYFENTYTPALNGIAGKYTYNSQANKDAFWGLMPKPGAYKFAKRQIRERWYDEGSFFDPGNQVQQWGNYYFPDYDHVGYRLLVGPENGLANESNWEVGSSPVQLDGNGRPYIDVTLKPAKKTDGTAYATQTGTAFPKVRFFLKHCPEQWLVDDTRPPEAGATTVPVDDGNNDDWRRRYSPQTGQDRRMLFTDTRNPSVVLESGTLLAYSLKDLNGTTTPQLDTATRWWGRGNAAGLTQARPIVDFRTTSAGDTTGIGGGTVQVVSSPDDFGKLLERGTKFVIRFEQYNAADYRVVDKSKDFGWLTSTSNQSNYPTTRTVTDMQRRGNFGEGYTDFYFEANALDAVGTDPSLLLPGAVASAKVTITGTGWASAVEFGEFVLRQRSTTPPASPTTTPPYGATYTDSQTYRWGTVQLIASTTAQRIGSVEIKSAGQYYYREPTILFKGGGGYGLKVQSTVSNGGIESIVIIDGGDGFSSDTELYTDVQEAKLLPVMRGTMRGVYRCAYRYADYRQTKILETTITTTSGSTTATLASTTGVKPDMQITGAAAVPHLAKIVSISGNTVTLSKAATATAATQACVIRDMSLPVIYSDFSPIVDVDASDNGSGRASTMAWSLPGVTPPSRAEYVEFFRTSADQSLVFYRLDQYGEVANGVITIKGTDTLSDEDLFNIDRPGYAALPVVLPNGGLNAFRFGTARNDMSVAVAWQDRLWYGVSTSGLDANTVFFSEYDEFESCPDINEIPIQNNLPSTDYLTALAPFGSVLMAMQSSHCYSIGFNTDPAIDAIVALAAHRGCLSQRTWDIFDEKLYAADERGVYSMTKSGEVESLSDTVRDYWDESKLDFSQRHNFHLRVDQRTNILRLWVSLAGQSAAYPTFALCYHIENKVWWTETWPNSITASTYYRPTNSPDTPIYGAIDGCLYQFSGDRDYSFRDLVSVAVTNGGSGYTSAPTVTASGGKGAELRAIIRDGQVQEILVVKGGYGYGTVLQAGFTNTVAITITGGGGAGATATGTAREPNSGTANDLPIRRRTSVPYSIRTGPMELVYEANARGGDGQIDRSITVTYQPLAVSTVLNLREYYNNSPTPRSNLMRRDRGTGFVHDTSGAKTTLDMVATRSTLGLSTGLAKAQFAGRSLDDISSADRHIAVELSGDASEVADNATVSQPLIYALEVRGVTDGS